ncbi:MAG: AAA family ATPase [candidate division Zixibacteria bacterium]|nr:AAA family ATPase [candidate division Zixibacteria bacterium]
MRTISIINQKGGCGKTTTAVNLSACLAEWNRKVLLVDLDPQGHSTISFDYQPDKLKYTAYDLFSPGKAGSFSWTNVLYELNDNLQLLPANLLLSFVEKELADFQGKERILLTRIMEIDEPLDYIVIDCPPSLGLLTVNALNASSEAIVPVEPSFFALHGLKKLLETVRLQEEKTGHLIKVKALTTIFNTRTRFSRDLLKEIQDHFGESMYRTTIRMSVALREAASFGKPICDYKKNSFAYQDYKALTDEIIEQEEFQLHKSQEKTLKPLPMDDGVLFRYKDGDAAAVMLAGDFNNWSPDRCRLNKKEMSGIWEKTLPLDPGTYQYRYVVDGRWIADPNNPIKADDNLGGFNSVITIS